MHIAILTHGVSPFGHGYRDAFVRAGHHATIISLTPMEAAQAQASAAIVLDQHGFTPWSPPSRWAYLGSVPRLRRVLRQIKPDLLFGLYLSSAGLVACLSGHPHVVVSAHGTDVHARHGNPAWRAIYRWMARKALFVHAVSDELAASLAQRVGIDRRRIMAVPIGIDTTQFAFVEPARRPNRGEILTTRAHDPVYGQITFLRALRRLRDRGVACTGVFASGRRYRDTVDLAAKEGVGEQTRFLGGFDSEDLPRILAEADVYVSCSRTDGTSQSLLEAMSSGLFPVVSAIEANRPWIVDGDNGFLFPVGDDAALARRLEEALANPALRATVAPRNRTIIEQHGDVHALAGQLLRRFEAALPAR